MEQVTPASVKAETFTKVNDAYETDGVLRKNEGGGGENGFRDPVASRGIISCCDRLKARHSLVRYGLTGCG